MGNIMTNFVVNTIEDEFAEDTNQQNQTDDGDGLALREAIALANDSVGADTIFFGSGILGDIFDISNLGNLFITDDLTIRGGVDVVNTSTSTAIEISNGADVTFLGFSLTNSVDSQFGAAVVITGDNVSLTNNADIFASGITGFSGDRSVGVQILASNVTLTNEAGGEIITAGRRAIEGISIFTGASEDYVIDVVNHGLIEGPDDGVSITSGTVTNSGTIRSTATFDFGGAFGVPGISSDAIQFWGAENAGYVTPDGGQGVVNNLATGIIEGGRSAIFFTGNGTLNNDGMITSEGWGIINNSGVQGIAAPAAFTINNTGTITNEGVNFNPNRPDQDISTIRLVSSGNTTSIDITNSGTISGASTTISIFNGGATLINEAGGQILSDKDNTGDDGIAFRGAQLEDYIVRATSSLIVVDPNAVFENTQGITVDANGQFVIPNVGVFGTQFGDIAVANVGGIHPLLPLVDIQATQTAGFLVFQTDSNFNLVWPTTIDIPSPTNGTITVDNNGGFDFTITDANGDPIYDVPEDVDFTDTITNAGLIEGDILTGLGDDVVTNTGTLRGDIYLGAGDDTVFAGAGNTAIFGGTGDDFLHGGAGGDALDGGDGIDTASYEGSTNRVNVSLLSGEGSGAQATNDTLTNIENLIGSDFGDTLRGDNARNRIDGADGNDVLIGFGGNDILIGGAGQDILTGGDGADFLQGGVGVDQARYNNSAEGVQINLLDGTASGGQAEGDILFNIENLFGSNHDDVLIGDENNNQILGNNGDDILAGNGGINTLFGGGGADTFVLTEGFSYVRDFVDDVDKLDVSAYGFASLEEALENLDQFGAHALLRVDDSVLVVLNTDVNDLMDDIIFMDDAMA